jgi:23S rRNA (guanine745-N1)-methyltransferase
MGRSGTDSLRRRCAPCGFFRKRPLLELRRLIYDEVRLSDEGFPESDLFEEVERRSLSYTVTLPDKEAIADLFMMTPFYYKTTEAGKVRLLSRDTLTVTVHVNYTIYKKKASV